MGAARRVGSVLVPALLLAGGSAAGEAPLRLVAGRLPVVRVVVAGSGPHDFLLDTGSTTSLLDIGLARRLGLEPVDRVELSSGSGTRVVTRVAVPELSFAGESVRGLRLPRVDLAELRRADAELVGVLGRDALRHFDVLLDFASARLLLDPAPAFAALAGAEHQPLAGERCVVVVAEAGRGEAPLRLLLDSGASGLVLFGREPRGVRLGTRGAVVDVSGARAADWVRLPRLEIGGVELRSVPALLADAGARGVDGLLPAGLFARVFIGYRSGGVAFGERGTALRALASATSAQ